MTSRRGRGALAPQIDSYGTRRTLMVGGVSYDYFSLEAAERAGLREVSRLPLSLKVLLENLIRHEDGATVCRADLEAVGRWAGHRGSDREVAFHPARVLMPDSSGTALLADLAAMRDARAAMGGDPRDVDAVIPSDLIVDHSVMVDVSGRSDALDRNLELEYARNGERYAFLRWGQKAFENLRVVPPGNGICHQINLEHLAQVVWVSAGPGGLVAYPDTMLGMDSHTPMANSLGVLGWGVGGIEAGAAMLGQPVIMTVPDVIGCRLTGGLREGVTATDVVLSVTRRLRARGVVGRFVEFFGPALDELALPDRATLANMAPEHGATVGFFPIDEATIRYLALTGRDPHRVALVEAYAKAQGLWRGAGVPDPDFTDVVEVDLSTVEPSVSGPGRPHDVVPLPRVPAAFEAARPENGDAGPRRPSGGVPAAGPDDALADGAVVIAAITSCTNTSNPSVMVAAGLLARQAVARGLRVKPWVKTSLAPGSRVVGDYLRAAGLQRDLDALGFHVVGFGCTTCMGNSGPLLPEVDRALDRSNRLFTAVLSGNRNFEGRVHPRICATFLASPPLVVAYAIAGSVRVNLADEPIGRDAAGRPVYLREIWPSGEEVRRVTAEVPAPSAFRDRYADLFHGDPAWRRLPAPDGATFAWDEGSTYIRRPPFLEGLPTAPDPVRDIRGARLLVMFGDMVTTDHISPVGRIDPDGPAGRYLVERGVTPRDFNSFVARRANHDVMIRGAFDNAQLRNELAPGARGAFTRHMPDGALMTIFDAARRHADEGVPVIVVAGAEYGAGSSRDWAAKATRLLGVRAVIAESFERIHRSNLVGMGVLPLQFEPGTTRRSLGLDGSEVIDVSGLAGSLRPRAQARCTVTGPSGRSRAVPLLVRLDTALEVEYYRHGGILPFVLRRLLG